MRSILRLDLRGAAGSEVNPIMMPSQSEQEFVKAMMVHREAMGEPSEVPSRKRKAQEQPSGSKDGPLSLSCRASKGVQELCQVKRQSKCMFCDRKLLKGEWKFTFALRRNAPPKSIHTDCLRTLDREAAESSLSTVQSWLANPSISEAQRGICAEAVESLQDVLQTGASASAA